MQLGMVGLGKMGANMTTRLIQGGHDVVVYDRSADAVKAAAAGGAAASSGLRDLCGKLTSSPKIVWIMVPSGKPTDDTIDELCGILGSGDIIIDGGNTNWKDGLAAYERCKAKGVSLVDAGTSGGVWGSGRLLPDGRRRRRRGEERANRSFSRSRRKKATRTSVQPAPVTSRRWCTTASSTA